MGIAAPDNLPAIASVLIAVCDGLMLQLIAETLEALTSLAAIAALGTAATCGRTHLLPWRAAGGRFVRRCWC